MGSDRAGEEELSKSTPFTVRTMTITIEVNVVSYILDGKGKERTENLFSDW